MDELLAEFVVEARELTQQAAEDLIALERDPQDRQRLESAFRAIHTLKGSVGLFPFGPLQGTLHAAEDVLGAAGGTGGTGEISAEAIEPILAILEWTDRCIDQIVATGELGSDAARQAQRLMRTLSQMPTTAEAALPASPGTDLPAWAKALFDAGANTTGPLVALQYVPSRDCFFNGDDPLALVGRVASVLQMSVRPQQDWPAPEEMDPFACNLVIELVSQAPLADIEALFRLIPDQVTIVSRALPAGPDAGGRMATAVPTMTTTIRVETVRIDRLLDIVGELYTAKNGLDGLGGILRTAEADAAVVRRAAATQLEFDRLLVRLRQAVMEVRMVPLAQTFRRLPRVVRELSTQTGKKVELKVTGGEIEADRLIVEGLFEPLLHVIRNAIDHGIEPAQGRAASGKPASGTIAVTAEMVGDRIALEVSDDGAGVDLERVRALALTRRLIAPDSAAGLADEAVLELLFAPGFSTAASVTEISGRGVGMDAVRSAVRVLGGDVAISTRAGQGSLVSLVLPTSFAMARLLIVEAGGDRFAVPMSAVAETLRVPRQTLVPIRGERAFVLRDRVVPFLDLAELLQLPPPVGDDILLLIVGLAAGGRVGIGIEAIGEQTEIMVRPPAGLLRHTRGLAGTAVLGDGRVVMVLDLEELAR